MAKLAVTEEVLASLQQQRPAYKWKVQEVSQYGATCVAYIDARQVMHILDSVLGPANWQDHYREVAGKVYCDLSVRIEHDEWVTKSDCGTESNFEGEKGQASDAFKRAAVKWGVGRFLYELGAVRIRSVLEAGKDQKGRIKYVPAHNGERIRDLTAHIRKNRLDPSGQDSQPQPQNSTRQYRQDTSQKQTKSDGAEAKVGTSQDKVFPATKAQRDEISRLCRSLNIGRAALDEWLKAAHRTSWQHLDSIQASAVKHEFSGMEQAHDQPHGITQDQLNLIREMGADLELPLLRIDLECRRVYQQPLAHLSVSQAEDYLTSLSSRIGDVAA
ncbi:MAG: Rad52/Rad22 family DNA repair protein [Candidatus Sericytochromatia bacterium]